MQETFTRRVTRRTLITRDVFVPRCFSDFFFTYVSFATCATYVSIRTKARANEEVSRIQ
jgi:hypothetical protein